MQGEGGPTPPQQQPPVSPATTDESVSSLSVDAVLMELNRRLGIMGETGERTSDMVARLAALQMRNTDAAARADAEFRELLSNSMAATNRAIGQMAIDIGSAAAGAASARGPLGGSADADADASFTRPDRPPPPTGSWLNDTDDGAHDPTVFDYHQHRPKRWVITTS